MSRITRDDIVHVARLARLSLSEAEVDDLTTQLETILAHAAQIEALDTDDVPPTAHPLEIANVWREDEPGACLSQEEALANAPEADSGHFKVPPP
jgi:aspartyl-tRNA(Asn)/glutamyl-tRNA(Gln) amidotransferase subunit C